MGEPSRSRAGAPTDVADVVIVGAGPAGLSAAVVAAEHGLRVELIDAGAQTGGQYWRHPEQSHLDASSAAEHAGQHHWRQYARLRARLAEAVATGAVTHRPSRQVWRAVVSHGAVVVHTTAVSGADSTPPAERSLRARRLIMATGAYDRQLPVPGWTLPGVMTAGGVQALLKAHRVAPGRRAVVAGTGPFLYSVAAALAAAGVEVVAVCEANALSRWAATPLRAVAEPGKLREGLALAGASVRHRIPLHTRTVVTAVRGEGRVREVALARVDATGRVRSGTGRTVTADLVAFGWGFTPQLELAVGLDLDTRLGDDGSLVVDVDDRQRTSHPVVYAAGESTGVGGAALACAEGELAALSVVADAGGHLDPRVAARPRRRVRRGRFFAAGMHRASPVPAQWADWLTPHTVVCRCEDVTAAEVAGSVGDLGADDARDVRVTARPGMGLCQGRVCGFALSRLVAQHTGTTPDAAALASLADRKLGVPITLGDLAALLPATSDDTAGRAD